MSFIMLYGRPGSGKTTLACSMTNLGYRIGLVDVDNKANEMENLRARVESKDIIIYPITAKLINQNLEDRLKNMQKASSNIPIKQEEPQGYLDYCRLITSFEKMMQAGEPAPFDVLVCDCFTRLQEHMRRLIMFLNKREKFTFDEWDMWKTNIEEFVVAHQRLQGLFKHVILISHEQFERDELIGKIEVVPMVDGSMKYKMAGYFTEVYHTFVEVKSNKAEYKVATKPLDRADARTSRNLEIIENANFLTLFKEEKK